MNRRKLQSAMEYLMTYGWAILIIAVVLGALSFLGIFNTGSIVPSVCTPTTPQFACSSYVYGGVGSTTPPPGNVLITLTQNTGTSWTSATAYFVPQSSEASVESGTSLSSINAGNTISGGMPSGQSITVTLPATGSVNLNTGLQGYVWVSYTSSGGSTVITQFAQVNVKAS
ncbi:MAG: hypothetical protein M1122_03145 [Candidatus Marsarchaeota archaeon]|jgi:hypothetical protein|nr:hypothetical protein [Candidatus Marsarchaeota archaeon]